MNEEKLQCECGELIEKNDFKKHFKKCVPLIHKYKNFDFKIIQLIKSYLDSKESFIIIIFFLQRYIKILNYNLIKIFNNSIKPSEKNKINSKSSNDKFDIADSTLQTQLNSIKNIDMNTEIDINFKSENIPGITYRRKGKLNEKLEKVIEDFLKSGNEPWMKNSLLVPIIKLDPQKTIYELGIKNTDAIFFMDEKKKYFNSKKRNSNSLNNDINKKNSNNINYQQNELYNDNLNNNSNNELNNNPFNHQQNELFNDNLNNNTISNVNNNVFNNQQNEFFNNNLNLNNNVNNNAFIQNPTEVPNNNNNNKFDTKAFILGSPILTPNNQIRQIKSQEIINPIKFNTFTGFEETPIDKHEHNLTFCITNFGWTCVKCERVFEGINPRYFCSLCNYNICFYCKDIRNYYIPFVFHKAKSPDLVVRDLFIVNSHHHHQLVYLSRYVSDSHMKCDVCQNSYDIETWSFYCTNCDFDICSTCIN